MREDAATGSMATVTASETAQNDANSATRACPSCAAPNKLDLSTKCVRCGKRLPLYCFACYAPMASERETSCASCGRRRWVIGDFAELRCPSEHGAPLRSQRYMETKTRAGKIVHEWRCMKCFAEDRRTDAFVHFPDRPLPEA